jgi:hypothetical protein
MYDQVAQFVDYVFMLFFYSIFLLKIKTQRGNKAKRYRSVILMLPK